ncbi:hypothetical protein AVO42_02245 [Thiomicrospira sp. XS5]|jgi:hypothetical protein|uniref:Uncharacterized protein n=1 Tax=Hydrogenovibrio thermophilus TaxID=265883 RepID=A0A451G4A7_9GAMM|nr:MULTISPECIES: hypothetical protein [Piscirickettsiaceae]KUJ74258.1 hypothetical protein AVO42_02245 [Thiomicrospira sp. XS5]QAB14298.1 hypothetical protein EPV75_00720 [Hydrogenovibrio thermophilus]
MEIGSKEHKQLLMKGILKIALKTIFLGWVLGVLLMVPSFIRENTFSIGLSYAGQTIIWIALIYALAIAYKKYRQTFGALKNGAND